MAARVKQYQWHRAEIIKVLKQDSFKVRLVDYGDVEYIHLDNIRYIRKHYIEIFPIQAIRCRLRQEGDNWTEAESVQFRAKIFNKDMVVRFKGKYVHKVSVNIIYVFIYLLYIKTNNFKNI